MSSPGKIDIDDEILKHENIASPSNHDQTDPFLKKNINNYRENTSDQIEQMDQIKEDNNNISNKMNTFNQQQSQYEIEGLNQTHNQLIKNFQASAIQKVPLNDAKSSSNNGKLSSRGGQGNSTQLSKKFTYSGKIQESKLLNVQKRKPGSIIKVEDPKTWQQTCQKMQQHMENARLFGKRYKLKQTLGKILFHLQSRRFKRLQQYQLKTFNDRAMVVKIKIKNPTLKQRHMFFWHSVDKFCGKILKKKPLHPMAKVNTVFQVLESIIILVDFLFYTWFCFYDYFSEELFFYLCLSSLIVFVQGTYLRLNTSFTEQGILIEDRTRIFNKWRRELFLNDMVGYVGFMYQLFQNNNDILTKQLSFFLIMKYKVFLMNVVKLEEKLNLSGSMVHAYSLIKLMGNSLALCHVVGTAYFFLAVCERDYLDEKNAWIQKYDIEEKDVITQYTESFYWALATITLIGTKGETTIETIYCIVALIFTIGIFATILSQVSIVWEEMAKKTKEYKKDRDILNDYFDFHNISTDLQYQLHNYLKYSYEGHKEKTANQEFDQLMQNYPLALQDQVKEERYRQEINNFTILSDNFSPEVMNLLIKCVQEEYFMPNQIIFTRDVYKEPRLYLILGGEAEIYQDTNPTSSVMTTLTKGDFFGHNLFFTDGYSYYSARSKGNSFLTVLTITFKQFQNILEMKGYEQDKEKFINIKHQLNQNGYCSTFNVKCFICGQLEHTEKECNLLNYKCNKDLLINKINHSVFQERHFKKRKYIRYKSRADMNVYLYYQMNILESPDLRKYLKVLQEHQKQLDLEQKQQDSYEEEEDDEEEEYYQEEDNENYDQNNSYRQFDQMNKLLEQDEDKEQDSQTSEEENTSRRFLKYYQNNIIQDNKISQNTHTVVSNTQDGENISKQFNQVESEYSPTKKNPQYLSLNTPQLRKQQSSQKGQTQINNKNSNLIKHQKQRKSDNLYKQKQQQQQPNGQKVNHYNNFINALDLPQENSVEKINSNSYISDSNSDNQKQTNYLSKQESDTHSMVIGDEREISSAVRLQNAIKQRSTSVVGDEKKNKNNIHLSHLLNNTTEIKNPFNEQYSQTSRQNSVRMDHQDVVLKLDTIPQQDIQREDTILNLGDNHIDKKMIQKKQIKNPPQIDIDTNSIQEERKIEQKNEEQENYIDYYGSQKHITKSQFSHSPRVTPTNQQSTNTIHHVNFPDSRSSQQIKKQKQFDKNQLQKIKKNKNKIGSNHNSIHSIDNDENLMKSTKLKSRNQKQMNSTIGFGLKKNVSIQRDKQIPMQSGQFFCMDENMKQSRKVQRQNKQGRRLSFLQQYQSHKDPRESQFAAKDINDLISLQTSTMLGMKSKKQKKENPSFRVSIEDANLLQVQQNRRQSLLKNSFLDDQSKYLSMYLEEISTQNYQIFTTIQNNFREILKKTDPEQDEIEKLDNKNCFFIDFDMMNEFQFYFVHNNYKNVIGEFKSYQLRQKNRQKKKLNAKKALHNVFNISRMFGPHHISNDSKQQMSKNKRFSISEINNQLKSLSTMSKRSPQIGGQPTPPKLEPSLN